ncbi:MAG: methyltransferase domain-containing protein [candidate division Zixibacteria bacterium]|jgi:SAM-dependent methyltransferase|nr:methyltransferase domain-containing protein [candidate division Zixibacteria bacterium]
MRTFDDRLAELDGGRVLDVGTGQGDFARSLAEGLRSYTEIIGIDFSESRIDEARHKVVLDRVRFELMDATCVQFAGESFDTVAISDTMHHLPDPRPILTEMKRVLKPGGLFCLVEAYRDGQDEAQMSHVLIHHWWAAIDTLVGVCHRESYLRAEVIGLVDQLGFARREVYDHREPDDDPHDADRIAMIDGLITRYVARIPDCPEKDELHRQGEIFRERLFTVGFSWAVHACVLAWK